MRSCFVRESSVGSPGSLGAQGRKSLAWEVVEEGADGAGKGKLAAGGEAYGSARYAGSNGDILVFGSSDTGE